MRVFIMIIMLLLSGCIKYIPAECPAPPDISFGEVQPIDTTLPPNEQVREMVIRYGQCIEYAKKADIALDVYR